MTEWLSSSDNSATQTGGQGGGRKGQHSIELSSCPPVLQELFPSGNGEFRDQYAHSREGGEKTSRPSGSCAAAPAFGAAGGRDQPAMGASPILRAPRLWLLDNSGCRLLRAGVVPFDWQAHTRPAGQTERLLCGVRLTAARKAARAVGGGGQARGPETDLQSAWELVRAVHGERGPPAWYEPAGRLGVTLAEAESRYGRATARRLFAMSDPSAPSEFCQSIRIGRRDAYGVWFPLCPIRRPRSKQPHLRCTATITTLPS